MHSRFGRRLLRQQIAERGLHRPVGRVQVDRLDVPLARVVELDDGSLPI
jgi:hypothetical protein